ncbi:hydroxyacylglutathione hydrolase [Catenovulum sp. 2E275]|uniref:hydroxyacylglutathione hydrolase n=1 Tax=Catenovulum sp. 2E275 TaxID=2980497 RepID=UPI0021CFBD07|nr:hydroxyacylglutathione hydrolase [Catenovulum sp. 2E275]MCU4674854.1 hydroxyacylglutathione hydrolase [Catenovulum sp. 2E275]
MNQVIALKAFEDNYIWVIHNSKYCVFVDPGDAGAVQTFLAQNPALSPVAILITHHHWDHTQGVTEIKKCFPAITVYGPANSPFKAIDKPLIDGDTINIQALQLTLDIWHTPGHTLDHIVYFNQQWLFCGDTLFSAGCGRMFEGTPELYSSSLNKLLTLPDNIKIYCTHEYTQANIRFAISVEPTNQQLIQYQYNVNQLRAQNKITLPTTLALEKQINPFLRCNNHKLVEQIRLQSKQPLQNPIETFAALRALKDKF